MQPKFDDINFPWIVDKEQEDLLSELKTSLLEPRHIPAESQEAELLLRAYYRLQTGSFFEWVDFNDILTCKRYAHEIILCPIRTFDNPSEVTAYLTSVLENTSQDDALFIQYSVPENQFSINDYQALKDSMLEYERRRFPLISLSFRDDSKLIHVGMVIFQKATDYLR